MNTLKKYCDVAMQLLERTYLHEINTWKILSQKKNTYVERLIAGNSYVGTSSRYIVINSCTIDRIFFIFFSLNIYLPLINDS